MLSKHLAVQRQKASAHCLRRRARIAGTLRIFRPAGRRRCRSRCLAATLLALSSRRNNVWSPSEAISEASLDSSAPMRAEPRRARRLEGAAAGCFPQSSRSLFYQKRSIEWPTSTAVNGAMLLTSLAQAPQRLCEYSPASLVSQAQREGEPPSTLRMRP